jgi:hypothetical protein
MSIDVHALADSLRSQLLDLGIEASAAPTSGSDAIALQLSPQAAQALGALLDSSRKRLSAPDSPADQDWEATSERVSEIEGFTGGDASD